jgi:hypothetical protein
VVAVAVQSVFRLEMHQNNVFSFLKINFDISTSKRSENTKKKILANKIQILREHDLHRISKHALRVLMGGG